MRKNRIAETSLVAFLLLCIASPSYANAVFDKALKIAEKRKGKFIAYSQEEKESFENKYTGSLIEGKGYVFSEPYATSKKGKICICLVTKKEYLVPGHHPAASSIVVYLTEDYSRERLEELRKEFQKGDLVYFSGNFDQISIGMIYVKEGTLRH